MTVGENESHSVPNELVHKLAASEALITAVAAEPDSWVLHARLPNHHPFHNDATGRQSGYHDPLLILEAFRQGCIAGSHVFYAIPLDFRYTLRYSQFAVLDWRALELCSEPAHLEFRTAIRNEFRQPGQDAVCGLTVSAVMTLNGTDAMELSGSFGWMPVEQWQRIRVGSSWDPVPSPPVVAPLTVGRKDPSHVVIGEPVRHGDDGSAHAPIVVDLADPTFFDHPLDHLPGALIIEACRQLAVAILGPVASSTVGLSRLRCDFHSFSELDSLCTVAMASAGDALSYRGAVEQSGQRRATVKLSFSELDVRS